MLEATQRVRGEQGNEIQQVLRGRVRTAEQDGEQRE